MRKSEIFDHYVKIAEDKGLVSNDSEKSKKKLEKDLRADSLDISAIEALYGVKPNAPKDMEYKKNIMEVAHPEPVVTAPSYDKLNGLVENNIERQNIMINIVNKTNDGIVNHKKYARKELLLSLVRVANDLDNKDQEELRVLADTCLVQFNSKKKIVKQAFDPITVGAVALIAATLGGLYAKQHLRFISDGFKQDHKKLIDELDDLIKSSSSWGVGYDLRPEFKQQIQELKESFNNYAAIEQEIEPILDKLQEPKSTKELMEVSKQPAAQEVNQAILKFRQETLDIWPKVQFIITNFSNDLYKQRQIVNKGFLSKIVDAPQILHGGWGLIADDFDDVVHAVQTYAKDIENINEILGASVSLQEDAAAKLQAAKEAPGAQYLGAKQPVKQPATSKGLGFKDRFNSLVDKMKESFSPGMSASPAPAADDHVTASGNNQLEVKLGIDQLINDFDKNL